MAFIGNTNTTQAFTPAVDYFSGNGSTTAFTLSRPVASVAQVEAVVNNVVQNPSSAYTVSGNTITFTSAPSSGTNNIYVRYTSPITQVIAPSQGTVTSTSLASSTGSGAVVLATSPTLVTPALGTPASGVMTNVTSLPSAQLTGTIPYSAFPAGTVIQTQYCNTSTTTTATTQTAQTELNTAYRVAITPIYSNSLIVLHYFVPMGANGSWTQNWIVDYSAMRCPSGSALNTNISYISSTGPANGARKRLSGSATRSQNGYDFNDQLSWTLTALDFPGSTSAVQYGFTWGGEGGGPIIVGTTTSNDGNWAFSANIVIVAHEIKQ